MPSTKAAGIAGRDDNDSQIGGTPPQLCRQHEENLECAVALDFRQGLLVHGNPLAPVIGIHESLAQILVVLELFVIFRGLKLHDLFSDHLEWIETSQRPATPTQILGLHLVGLKLLAELPSRPVPS